VEKCYEYANADSIAYGLSPFAPVSAGIEAGRILLNRIWTLRDAKKSFGFESTLAGKTYVHFLKECTHRDFSVRIYFLWVGTPELALKRVADRVRQGGHSVPAADVRRRYFAGLRNLFHLYRPLADYFAIIDNSGASPELTSEGIRQEFF